MVSMPKEVTQALGFLWEVPLQGAGTSDYEKETNSLSNTWSIEAEEAYHFKDT